MSDENDMVAADLLDDYGFHRQAEIIRNGFRVEVGKQTKLQLVSGQAVAGSFTEFEGFFDQCQMDLINPRDMDFSTMDRRRFVPFQPDAALTMRFRIQQASKESVSP